RRRHTRLVSDWSSDVCSSDLWAALNGNAEIADLLIHAGANVRATTRLGAYTPLFMAAKAGRATLVEMLLKAGADPKTPAIDGIRSEERRVGEERRAGRERGRS